MPDALVVSGGGPYADAWHRFAETSGRLADIIAGLGHSVEVTDDVEAALAAPACRLLVINIGNPQPSHPGPTTAVSAGLQGHLDGGGALLGIHSSATVTALPRILGGRWVPGITMHPTQGHAKIIRTDTTHPITTGLGDIDVVDERYSYLATEPDVTVLYEHDYQSVRHPVVWTRETERCRVVYSALGHDTASYDSLSHVALLRRAVTWLLNRQLVTEPVSEALKLSICRVTD
ncbi:MAG TPA: ThuA domain-containing protein [Propionibacteriaceae bacterium]|nr:ThuA domain-containing protein [Propionibacteriaceae bacterium]